MELQIGQIAKLPTYLDSNKPGYVYVTACEYDPIGHDRCEGCTFKSGPMHGGCQNYKDVKNTVGNCGHGHLVNYLNGIGERADHKDVIFKVVGNNRSDEILGVTPTKDVHIGTMILGDAASWYAKNNKFCKDFALRFFTEDKIKSYANDHSHRLDIGYCAMHIDEAKMLYASNTQIRKNAVKYFFSESEIK